MKPRIRVMATAHQAASLTRSGIKGWMPQHMSADAALLPEMRTIVSRAQDMDRNSGVAVGAARTLEDNILGSGLRLALRPDYRAMKRTKEWAIAFSNAVESQWHAYYWSHACHAGDWMTGDSQTGLAFRSTVMQGEATALPLWLDRGDGVFTKMQVVDPDRLSQPDGRPNTHRFKAGIEYDEYGRKLACHFRKTHPGDHLIDQPGWAEWERVPYRTPFGRLRVIHAFEPERSGQTRGKPLLTPVMAEFKNVDQYKQGEIRAALANALVAMVVKSPMTPEQVIELFSREEDPAKAYREARERSEVGLTSGGILSLFPGDEAQSFIPSRPAAAFGQFLENAYRIVGLPMGLPLELLLRDFSKTNYSSARASLLEAWRSFLRRRDSFGTQWMDPWFGLWAEERAHAGTLGDGSISAQEFYEFRPFLLRTRWVGGGRGWIDPLKEALASQARMDADISTLEDECWEQGKDWREVLEQKAVEKAEKKRLGLDEPPPLDGRTAPKRTDDDDDDGEQRIAA